MKDIVTVRQVKNHNVTQIRKALRSIPCGTKNTMAGLTGLSIATCNTILNELEMTGEISVVEGTSPGIGRPAKMYRFNEAYAYICCVFPTMEAGVRRLRYAVTDLRGHVIREESPVYARITVEEIKALLSRLLEEEKKIRAVSLGIPGYYAGGKICSCGIEELNGCNIQKELEQVFACEIFVENDVNAMAYGMCHCEEEAWEPCENLVLTSYFKGRGTGSGIVFGGQIYHGHTNFAGETDKLNYGGADVKELLSQGEEGILKALLVAVEDLTAILNPEVIFFIGDNVTPELLGKVEEAVEKRIGRDHLPCLRYVEDWKRFYIQGLGELVLEGCIL